MGYKLSTSLSGRAAVSPVNELQLMNYITNVIGSDAFSAGNQACSPMNGSQELSTANDEWSSR